MEKSILRIIRVLGLMVNYGERKNLYQGHTLKEMQRLLDKSADEVTQILEGKKKLLKDLDKDMKELEEGLETKYDRETLDAVIKELTEFKEHEDRCRLSNKLHRDQLTIGKCIQKIEDMKVESMYM